MADDVEPAEDDLAQLVLRDLAAGVLTALVALGGFLIVIAALRGDADRPLVSRPGPALGFAIGAGLGLGLAFASAEGVALLWSSGRRKSRGARALDLFGISVASGLTLALLAPAAPLLGTFELLFNWGPSGEASRLIVDGLQSDALVSELAFFSLAAVLLGLPHLLARREGVGRTSQAAAAAAAAAAWFVVAVALGVPFDLPTSAYAVLLLGGSLAAVAALDLCDRLLRRLRRRAASPRPGRRRAPAAVALVALLAATGALVTPHPRERPIQLLARVRAALTSDPERLEELARPQLPSLGDALSIEWNRRKADGLWILDSVGLLGVPLVPFDDSCRAPVLLRAARAGVEPALDELAWPLEGCAVGRDGPGLVRAAARVAVHAPADDEAPPDRCPAPGWWRERTAPWRTDPAHRAVVAHHVALARAGHVDALGWLALLWEVAPPCRAEVEHVLGQVASGCVGGDPDLVPWRAVERLVSLASSPESTSGLLDVTFAALRRHAVREGAPIVAPAARRVLLELLLKHPDRRLAEDQERVPDRGVEVVHPLLGLASGLVAASGRPASLTELAEALRRTSARATAGGPGGAAFEALARGDRREALRLALEGLRGDRADADALRALARVDLECALEADRAAGPRAALCSRADAYLTWAFERDPTNPVLLMELAVARAAGGAEAHRGIEARVWLLAARTLDPGASEPVALALERALPGAAVRDDRRGDVLVGPALLARVLVDRAGERPAGQEPSPVRRARSRLAARLAEVRR